MNDVPFERWLPIAGFEGVYEVSNLGRVRSLPRPRTSGGVIASSPGKAGHRHVTLWQNGIQTGRTVHSLVMEAFVGPRPDGLEVLHRDGNAGNNVISNLHYGTHAENVQDTVRHGRHVNANKTHCKRNHPFDEKNTYVSSSGGRVCRACQRLRNSVRAKQNVGLVA